MSTEFKIIERKRAQRCEICHQADMFDGMTEICQRCLDTQIALADKMQASEVQPASWSQLAGLLILVFFLCLGFSMAWELMPKSTATATIGFIAWFVAVAVILSRKFGVSFLD